MKIHKYGKVTIEVTEEGVTLVISDFTVECSDTNEFKAWAVNWAAENISIFLAENNISFKIQDTQINAK